MAVYRAAHRPRVRREAGPEEEEEAGGGAEAVVPAEEDPDTELEGPGVYEGPAVAPWVGIEAIFDNPQEEDEEEDEEAEEVASNEAYGSELLSAPSVDSLEADSQPSSVHVIDVVNSPGECINMIDMVIDFCFVMNFNHAVMTDPPRKTTWTDESFDDVEIVSGNHGACRVTREL